MAATPSDEQLLAAFLQGERAMIAELVRRYSMAGRQAILYFSEIPSGRPVAFSYQLRARFPVRVKTPRSTVYQYYEPAVRDTAAPIELTIL